ncbi:hypothetical protein PMAYCL1PPCAC_07381 [Pristionchus mayeri]|uniref:SSD domain-containing protein n=1 Tax=Pristionchus mayeri TaxID=1317129 RepID=A0AAN4ZAS2_9BILA|nr:hypothetical protein PMAYCL1PPCAC_07381 [Pristionchus mayeri]
MRVHSEEEPPPGRKMDKGSGLRQRLQWVESWVVGRSDSGDYSAAWREKFSHAPTWSDADMALQQINRGLASGNRVALYARSFFQHCLYYTGCFVQKWAWPTIVLGILLYTVCCWGLQYVTIETDIVKLWVPQGGRLQTEMDYVHEAQAEARRRMDEKIRIKREALPQSIQALLKNGTKPVVTTGTAPPELPNLSDGLGGGFQVVIQTPSYVGENALTKEGMLRHVHLMQEISQYKVELFGENWSLADICFKPPGPKGGNGPLAKVMNTMLDKIIPCIWITPIDCFWEGSKPLGPDPPLYMGEEITAFVNSMPKGNVSWKNLNPTAVVKEVSQLFDMGPISNFFERAGIDAAYLERPCIDPLDPECPALSPNYFDRCEALTAFNKWNKALPTNERVNLTRVPYVKEESKDIADSLLNDLFVGKKRRKRATASDDYYDYEKDDEYDTSNGTDKKPSKEEIECMEYGVGLLEWMGKTEDKWGMFLTDKQKPKSPNFGELMTGGCRGFSKKIMDWPEDLIVGGINRAGHNIDSAEALQSVFLVASPGDVYHRFKEPKDIKPNLDTKRWTRWHASKIIQTWQRNFTKKLYTHKANTQVQGVRQFHPLASTSIADMLEEFSQFNYGIIIMGYVLMLIYAAFTQARIEGRWLAIESNVALAIVGVVWVTYSSICGLGFATLLGINFNAATTQVVPFLSLGLGIDDMFLLLHNYDEIFHLVHKNEMGVLLKETGMSVLVTSTNNILAFIAGMVLPIPALKSFCSQTAILLAFNLLFLMILFPAFITIDLRRRRKGIRDMGWCLKKKEMSGKENEAVGMPHTQSNVSEYPVSSQTHLTTLNTPTHDDVENFEREDPWYTVGGFLKIYYIPALKRKDVRYLVLGATIACVAFGLIGMYNNTLGLELSDVLPANTAPAAFIAAREKYFSFYPMFSVIKGGNVNIPRQQQQIEAYRQEMAESRFVIKGDDGKPQEYWLSLIRTWLVSLDKVAEKAIQDGELMIGGEIPAGKKPEPEVYIARAMLCSVRNSWNCTDRVGKIKMVNEEGVVREDAFYNYLTGWYNVDNMMYYVSQASFIPLPPHWEYTKDDVLVPPAEPLLYSQIPFYTTGLTTTPSIVESIKELRAVCDKYTEAGLDNYPQGLAFTFWEQYLTLRWNLFLAILIIAAAVFTVIASLIFNPYAAFLVMIIVVVTTIELGGFMGLFGVKMNPISAVTLICAVGIGVEFSAHVMLAFLTSLGSVETRLQSCLLHMFVPVFQGAISTLLGIVMLVFTEFDFVFKYFFVVMSVLVVIGIFNGLCLLPCILTFIGPKCELTPAHDPNHLPAPPPIKPRPNYHYMEQGSLRRRKGNEDVEMTSSPSSSMSSSESAPHMPAPLKADDKNHSYHDSLSTIAEEPTVKRM